MTTLTFVQGDDWEIDFFFERLVDGVWTAEALTDGDFAMSLKRDTYEQALTFVSVDAAEGHGRFLLASGVSAAAPIAELGTNIRVITGGKRASTLPFTVKVVEDFTP